MPKDRKQKLKEIAKEYPPLYTNHYYDDYIKDLLRGDIQYIENMSAKEPLNEEQLQEMLNSTDYFAEEKYDGVRADLHFGDKIRCFSRRISKKTGWYSENTDNVPHIRDLKYPEELKGTVLDGEFRILSGDFKDISSLMNCNFDEAILRQKETGKKPTFIAFDILYYKGISVMKLPLHKRKDLLAEIIRKLPSECDIIQSSYTDNKMHLQITDRILTWLSDEGLADVYPTLAKEVYRNNGAIPCNEVPYWDLFSKQAWYEYVLLNEGEGLMLKHKDGKYYMKRCREYTKYKKFLTREVVISGFIEPTKVYEGKAPETWEYWEGDVPVTKHYAKGWIGTVKYSVLITQEELEELKKKNPKEKYECYYFEGNLYLEIGDCGGIDEETREYMTQNRSHLIGKVIEVGCNDIIKKTGKLRHPRFLRFRPDKNNTDCTFRDHLGV